MTPDEYCQEKTARSGTSFYYSFLFLPPERRRAITALYAFCREVDDVVDEVTDPELARTKLAWWRARSARRSRERRSIRLRWRCARWSPRTGCPKSTSRP
jgi:phytoene/squalene synthetase